MTGTVACRLLPEPEAAKPAPPQGAPSSRLPDPKDGLHMASASLPPVPPRGRPPRPLGHVLTGCSVPGDRRLSDDLTGQEPAPLVGSCFIHGARVRHQGAARPPLSRWVCEAEGEADVKHTDTVLTPTVRARAGSLHPAAQGGRVHGSTHAGTRFCPHRSLSSRGLGWCPRFLIVPEGTGPPADVTRWPAAEAGRDTVSITQAVPAGGRLSAPFAGSMQVPSLITHRGRGHASTTTSRASGQSKPARRSARPGKWEIHSQRQVLKTTLHTVSE